VLDGILLERRGIPAVSIVTDKFSPTGRAITRLWGVPDYRFLSMPHPLSYLQMDQICRQALELLPDVRDLLTRQAD